MSIDNKINVTETEWCTHESKLSLYNPTYVKRVKGAKFYAFFINDNKSKTMPHYQCLFRNKLKLFTYAIEHYT